MRRGHAPIGFVQLAKAKYVVCAPSSFAVWPALANMHNHIYMQPSFNLADGREIHFHENFHYISFPRMFTYSMSKDDIEHPIETAKAMVKIVTITDPRCEVPLDRSLFYLGLNNSRHRVNDWDCYKPITTLPKI